MISRSCISTRRCASLFLATSGSENDSTAHRRRLGKLVESRQEIEDNHLSTQLSITGTGTILEQGENGTWKSPSSPIASSIPRKLTSDLSHVTNGAEMKIWFAMCRCFSRLNGGRVLALVNRISPRSWYSRWSICPPWCPTQHRCPIPRRRIGIFRWVNIINSHLCRSWSRQTPISKTIT